MIERLKNWFRARKSGGGTTPESKLYRTGAHPAPRRAPPSTRKVPRRNPEFVEADGNLSGRFDANDRVQDALIRNKYLREEAGTHETLTILDDSMVDSGEEPGDDPYNTGGFDRSRNWERRFGK